MRRKIHFILEYPAYTRSSYVMKSKFYLTKPSELLMTLSVQTIITAASIVPGYGQAMYDNSELVSQTS